MARKKKNPLSPLENKAMNVIWDRGNATAEDVRVAMEAAQKGKADKKLAIKDSTVRTVLRRLEEKGYVKHTVDGRTYVYSPKVASKSVAADAVRGIIDRFCDGSIEDLLVGMVDDELVSADTLKQLAAKIAKAEATEKKRKKT